MTPTPCPVALVVGIIASMPNSQPPPRESLMPGATTRVVLVPWPETCPTGVVKNTSVIGVIPRRNGGRSTFATLDKRYGIEYWTEKPAWNTFVRAPAPIWYPAEPVIASGRQ